LLMDIMSSIMAFVSITYNFVGECSLWTWLDWECLLTGLFNCKVCFQAIICVCDRKAFSHLFAIVSKYQFSSKFWLEFRQYMVVDIEVPLTKETLHEDSHVLLSLSLLQMSRYKHKKDVLEFRSFMSLV
jgi:hypothetical protein